MAGLFWSHCGMASQCCNEFYGMGKVLTSVWDVLHMHLRMNAVWDATFKR